ncbi:hypothetical protein MMC13_001792 [Lambiella insularis]|nr:hypothetical protein [Lambiella insularis]
MTQEIDVLKSEIRALKAKVRRLEQHHQRCAISKRKLPLFDNQSFSSDTELLPDVELPPSNAENPGCSDLGVENIPSTLKIVPFIADRPRKKPCHSVPRWKRVADRILEDVPDAKRWIPRRQELRLKTNEDYNRIVATVTGVCGNGNTSQRYTTILPSSSGTSEDNIRVAAAVHQNTTLQSLTGNLIRSAKACAQLTRTSQVLSSFQELVFVSLCVVLECHGIPVDHLDEIMRICISDSEPPNLRRLRRGALWANRVIFNIGNAGWGIRATELFLLYGRSTSQYGVLHEHNSMSFPYFTEHLKLSKYIEHTFEDSIEPEQCHFSIPAFIEVWLGGDLKLTQICVALGYDEHYASGNLGLCRKYHGLVRGASNGSPTPAVSNSHALGVDSAQSNNPITVGAGNDEGQLGKSISIETRPIQTGSTIDAFTRGPQEPDESKELH